jgi:hypothetical protein
LVLRRLKQLEKLEKQFCVQQEISERVEKIQELLRQHEELMKELRSDPEYSVEWETEIVDGVVQDLVEKGFLNSAKPLAASQSEEGGD